MKLFIDNWEKSKEVISKNEYLSIDLINLNQSISNLAFYTYEHNRTPRPFFIGEEKQINLVTKRPFFSDRDIVLLKLEVVELDNGKQSLSITEFDLNETLNVLDDLEILGHKSQLIIADEISFSYKGFKAPRDLLEEEFKGAELIEGFSYNSGNTSLLPHMIKIHVDENGKKMELLHENSLFHFNKYHTNFGGNFAG